MPKKSYRRRNRGGDDEFPKKTEEIREEIDKELPPMELPREEQIPPTPKEEPWKEEAPVPEPAPPIPREEPAPPEPAPKEEPWKEQEPAPKEDSWLSPQKNEPVPSEETPAKPSIFTFGFILALVFTLIPLILLSLGIYILARKPLYPSETTGTVTSAKCVNNNCILVIEFTPEGATDKLTSNELQISGNYNKGDSVKINYNPDAPSTFGVNLISPKVFGWSFIGLALVLLLIIWAIYYFTR